MLCVCSAESEHFIAGQRRLSGTSCCFLHITQLQSCVNFVFNCLRPSRIKCKQCSLRELHPADSCCAHMQILLELNNTTINCPVYVQWPAGDVLTCRVSARRFVARCAAVSPPGYTAWYEIADKEHNVAQVRESVENRTTENSVPSLSSICKVRLGLQQEAQNVLYSLPTGGLAFASRVVPARKCLNLLRLAAKFEVMCRCSDRVI